MIPLELISLACAVPGLSIRFFAIRLSANDGLLTLYTLFVAVGTGILTWQFWHF